MMHIKWFIFFAITLLASCTQQAQQLSIEGNRFFMDGEPLPMWGVRLASATQNEDNTNQLIENLDDYRSYGIRSFSIYVQGSSGGFSDPFRNGGREIDAGHLGRLERMIESAAERSMVVIVGIFYQRSIANMDSVSHLHDAASIERAVETLTRALTPYRNVIINIANEQNSGYYRRFEAFDFNDPGNIIRLCKRVKATDPDRIVGAGGYNDTSNVTIGKSEFVDVLLFDTYAGDIEENHHSGWHYDYFRKMGVPDKPMINVELFGGWTRQFIPPGVYTEEGKRIHTREIDEALQRPGLHVHFHSNAWLQGPSDGYPIRYDLGGMGTENDPGIRWWFAYLKDQIE